MKLLKFIVGIVIIVFTTLSCHSEEPESNTDIYSAEEFNTLSKKLTLPETPFSYGLGNPGAGLKVDHLATLGRVLFYDKNLSSDRSVSCASCHQQSFAFADNKSFSTGANGNITKRNSISLGSVRSFGIHYNQSNNKSLTPGLFWDERAETISEQLRQTISNPNEMGMELGQIAELVESEETYRILHEKAFDSEKIKEENVLIALEAFINSFGSTNTRLGAEILENLNFVNGDYVAGTSEHKLGIEVFLEHCNTCHGRSIHLPFQDGKVEELISVANNGLLLQSDDKGVFVFSGNSEDIGKFKIPGLLNIELTAPYMHDGRFESLEEVVEFYNSGINNSLTLHPLLKDNEEAKRLNLSEVEKIALVDFLMALTDESLATNKIWSNPFLN